MTPKQLKLLSLAIQVLPVVIVTGCYTPLLVSNASTGISFAAIVVIFIVALICKDNLLKHFQSLNWTKVCIVIAGISAASLFIAEPLLVASCAGLVGSIIAYPLEMKYKQMIDDQKETEKLNKLKAIMKGEDT